MAALAMTFAAAGAAAADTTATLLSQQSSAPAAAIGLFLTTSGPDLADGQELRRGAEIAVEVRAASCALLQARSTGQWNAGASELVRLVYSDRVKAVLGPADGRTAHLAEQVVARAKGRFVLLTPWASDPTLTEIRVPWFFRLVPDDRRQAEALLGEMRGRFNEVAVLVAESEYDFRTAWEAFEKEANARGAPQLHKVPVRGEAMQVDDLPEEVRATDPGAVLFLAPAEAAAQAARRLREAGITVPFFGPLKLASPAFLDAAGDAAEGMVLVAPAEAAGASADGFQVRYRRAYNREPSAVTAYGYDSAMVLIDAMQSVGNADGESLRAALAATRREGMTGKIEFDASGNRAGPAPLARIEHGRLRSLHGVDP